LDILKVAATLAVVKLHSGHEGMIAEMIHYLCGFAVPIFFMVSGALILNKSWKSQNQLWKYILNRVLHIILLIFIWNSLFVGLKILKNKTFINPLKYFIGALFQDGFLNHFWFLWALIMVYLVTPFLIKIINENNKKIFTIAIVTCCFIISSISIYRGMMGMPIVEEYIPQAFRIWTHIMYFWLGGLLYCEISNRNIYINILFMYCHCIFLSNSNFSICFL